MIELTKQLDLVENEWNIMESSNLSRLAGIYPFVSSQLASLVCIRLKVDEETQDELTTGPMNSAREGLRVEMISSRYGRIR